MTGAAREVIRRLALAPVFLLVILTLLFFLLRVLPGDPITAIAAGQNITPAELEALREAAGLNRPLGQQYISYLAGVAQGDFGQPITDPRPVSQLIGDLFPATLELTLIGLIVIGIPAGVVMGVIAAVRRGRWLDSAVRVGSIAAFAAPVFWTGILLQFVFAVSLGIFPTARRVSPSVDAGSVDRTGMILIDSILAGRSDIFVDAVLHVALPGVTLGALLAGALTRLVRANTLLTLEAPYVEAAVMRGIPRRRVLRTYVLRNAMIPVVTLIGLEFALLLGGAVLVETTFSWPGLGKATVDFIAARDYVAVQGIVTFYAVIVTLVSLTIDLIHTALDPRVRVAR